MQAQSIRSLRRHSGTASLRSSLDGQELGCEKLKALVEKFKLEVEQEDDKNNDKDNNSTVSESTTEEQEDDSVEEEEQVTASVKPAASSAISTAVVTNEQVRSKLLNRLGIQNASIVVLPEANPRPPTTVAPPSFDLPLNDAGDYENWQNRKLTTTKKTKNPFAFFAPRSDSNVTEDSSKQSSSSSSSDAMGGEAKENQETTTNLEETTEATAVEQGESLSPSNNKKSVHFHATVKAHSIPSHKVYSKRIKQTIWSSAAELEENVARNCYEFEAENWNFDDVVDDEDMVWYHGQWVHPVHFVDFPWPTSSTKKAAGQ